jgi:hypothetical protein
VDPAPSGINERAALTTTPSMTPSPSLPSDHAIAEAILRHLTLRREVRALAERLVAA